MGVLSTPYFLINSAHDRVSWKGEILRMGGSLCGIIEGPGPKKYPKS